MRPLTPWPDCRGAWPPQRAKKRNASNGSSTENHRRRESARQQMLAKTRRWNLMQLRLAHEELEAHAGFLTRLTRRRVEWLDEEQWAAALAEADRATGELAALDEAIAAVHARTRASRPR